MYRRDIARGLRAACWVSRGGAPATTGLMTISDPISDSEDRIWEGFFVLRIRRSKIGKRFCHLRGWRSKITRELFEDTAGSESGAGRAFSRPVRILGIHGTQGLDPICSGEIRPL